RSVPEDPRPECLPTATSMKAVRPHPSGGMCVLHHSLVRRSDRCSPVVSRGAFAHRARIGARLLWWLSPALLAASWPAASLAVVTVAWSVVNQWNTGYQAGVTIANDSDAAVPSWNLEFDLQGSIVSVWNANLTSSNTTRSASGVGWNDSIPAHGSVAFGFIGGPYQGAVPEPTSCLLDGHACVFAGVSPPPSSL